MIEFEQTFLPLDQPPSDQPVKTTSRSKRTATPPPAAGPETSSFSIPRGFLRKMEKLTEGGLRVYLALCGLADEEGRVVGYRVDQICGAAGLCERAVQGAFLALEKHRLLKRFRADGKRTAYRIL